MPTDYEVIRMAAFTALDIASNEGTAMAQSWLAAVCDNPAKWHIEADAFNALVSGQYTYEEAGAAINAAMLASTNKGDSRG